MSRCWHYVGGKCPAGNGGKRAVLREEHEVSRKAIAQGRPGCARRTCMPVCTSLPCANGPRDGGCGTHPVFPAPCEQGERITNLGRFPPRECGGVSSAR